MKEAMCDTCPHAHTHVATPDIVRPVVETPDPTRGPPELEGPPGPGAPNPNGPPVVKPVPPFRDEKERIHIGRRSPYEFNPFCCCQRPDCSSCNQKEQQAAGKMLMYCRSISVAAGPIKSYAEMNSSLPDSLLLFSMADKIDLMNAISESLVLGFFTVEVSSVALEDNEEVLKTKEDIKELFAYMRRYSTILKSISTRIQTSPSPSTQ